MGDRRGGAVEPQYSGEKSVKHDVKFGHFVSFSNKYHPKFGIFVNFLGRQIPHKIRTFCDFLYTYFQAKMSYPAPWIPGQNYKKGGSKKIVFIQPLALYKSFTYLLTYPHSWLGSYAYAEKYTWTWPTTRFHIQLIKGLRGPTVNVNYTYVDTGSWFAIRAAVSASGRFSGEDLKWK